MGPGHAAPRDRSAGYSAVVPLDLDRLAAALPELSRAQLQRLMDAWEGRGRDEPSDFISWLHGRGALPAGSLRDLSAATPVVLTSPEAAASSLRLLGELGRGSMGEVLLAQDERLHRTIVVKRLHARLADEPQMVRRFVAEAQLTAQLDHPGIVPVHAVDARAGEPPTYAMKLVRGQTLRTWFNETRAAVARPGHRPTPPAPGLAARLELFLQMCEPIAYAHSRGVIHRDLKPDNIMVGPYGEVFVMDWGIARLTGSADVPGPGRAGSPDGEGTLDGAAIGTPVYMSPEQARGENSTMDGRSDQYTLGLLLYEMATLNRARASIKNAAKLMIAAARGHVEPVVAYGEPIPRELRAVILRATAPDPVRRYADVSALADDVRRVLRGEPVLAAPDTLVQRAGRWIARRRERVAVGLVVAALLALLAVLVTVLGGLGVREWDRVAADARAARLVAVTAQAADHARALDGALSSYEGLLRALAAVAERALPGDATAPVYLAPAFADPTRAPPDMVSSKVYRGPASFDHPDLALAPGVDEHTRDTARELRVLASLRDVMADTLLNSASAPARGSASSDRALVLDQGTPVVWSYVATGDGVLVGFPGVGRYPPDYDPRQQPWYHEGLSRTGPGWGRPYVDESGMGLLVSCSMPVRSPAGGAVAGLDLTVKYLVETWLAPGGEGEGFLLDDSGAVIVRSGGAQEVPGTTQPLPWPSASAPIAAAPNGHLVVGETLLAWSRLTHGWTYLLAEGSE